jgi:hypothetical protein
MANADVLNFHYPRPRAKEPPGNGTPLFPKKENSRPPPVDDSYPLGRKFLRAYNAFP